MRQGYAGQSWLPAGKPAPARPGHPLSSRRERGVLGRIAEGRRQIAAEMGVAVKTMDTYRRPIMQKLGP